MTTIVGIQGDGFAVLANDSRISDTDTNGFVSRITTVRPGSGKIAKNGKYLIGAAGDMRAINILHHVFTPPTPPANTTGVKLDKFFTNRFIPDLRECFDSQGYSSPTNDQSDHVAEQGSSIIVAIHGVIYTVDGDYSWVSDNSGIYSLGTGSPYALGALKALFPKKKFTAAQAKSLALKALMVASHYDPHTGSPFYSHVQEQQVSR
jgi:ATP-dependent protease HslVU (ClpYQ) peptidase subunit